MQNGLPVSDSPSALPSAPGAGQTVNGLLERAVHRNPRGTALALGDRRLSYESLERRVARLAGGVAALGVRPGGRGAGHTHNALEHVQGGLPSLRLGAFCVPINVRLAVDEVDHVLAETVPAVLVTDQQLARRCGATALRAVAGERRMVLGGEAAPDYLSDETTVSAADPA